MMTQTKNITAHIKNQAYDIAKIASDHKGFNIRICDLENYCSYAGYFIMISCSSVRQTAAIADAIVAQYRVKSNSVEGKSSAEWILVDLGDIVVHVFEESAREYYMLDRTWGHVPSHLYVEPQHSSHTTTLGSHA